MKIWKIEHANRSQEPIKVGVILGSMASTGIILKPGQFCLSKPHTTAALDSQRRKGFVVVLEDFINESGKTFELGVAYNNSDLIKPIVVEVKETIEESPINKMDEAEKLAIEYISKSEKKIKKPY